MLREALRRTILVVPEGTLPTHWDRVDRLGVRDFGRRRFGAPFELAADPDQFHRDNVQVRVDRFQEYSRS
jgi:hypothetical protein